MLRKIPYPMVALVDANNFYVSCERLFRPDLINRPLVVLSNNDGCVVSRSNEVKAMGISVADPWFKIRREMEARGVLAFSSNYTLYADISNRMVSELRALCPRVELYSIDESFLDLKGFRTDTLPEFGAKIKRTLQHNIGIPTSVGIGPSKTLAKVAAYFAKKHPKLKGVCVIRTEAQRIWALQHIPIGEIWGIGRSYARWLSSMKVQTAWDFTEMPPEVIRRNMKVVGLRIQSELKGQACITLEELQPAKKVIATTRSFKSNVAEKAFVKESVAFFATRCAEKLRKQHSAAQMLTVLLYTDKHNEREQFVRGSFTLSLPQATNHTLVLVQEALKALEYCYQSGLSYKKAGVMVSEIVPDNQVQTSLYHTAPFWNNTSLCRTLDALNHRYGRDFVKLAALGTGKEWGLRQENLSPQYSTSLQSLIRVKLHTQTPAEDIVQTEH